MPKSTQKLSREDFGKISKKAHKLSKKDKDAENLYASNQHLYHHFPTRRGPFRTKKYSINILNILTVL